MTPVCLLTPSHNSVSRKNATTLDLLLQIQHPTPSTASNVRPRMNLSLVVDVSGSMAGSPLHHATTAALSLIDRLTDTDRLAIVVYANQARVVAPSAPATPAQKTAWRHVLTQLTAQGGTALHAGWLQGAHEAAPFVGDYDLTRVLLLSDGQANVGPNMPQQFKEEAQKLLQTGISTSSYGVGLAFNEDLMTAIAQGGQAFYAQSADQLSAYFNTDMDLMAQVALKNVRFSIQGMYGDQPHAVNVLNDLGKMGSAYCVPDVLFGGESWAVAQMVVPETTSSCVVVVDIQWTTMQGMHGQQQCTLSLPARATAKPNTASNVAVLSERVKELKAAALQHAMLQEARQNRWENVDALVGQMTQLSPSNAYLSGVANTLATATAARDWRALSKEATYGAHVMNTRSALIDEDVTSAHDRLGLRKTQQGKAAPPSPQQGEHK